MKKGNLTHPHYHPKMVGLLLGLPALPGFLPQSLNGQRQRCINPNGTPNGHQRTKPPAKSRKTCI